IRVLYATHLLSIGMWTDTCNCPNDPLIQFQLALVNSSGTSGTPVATRTATAPNGLSGHNVSQRSHLKGTLQGSGLHCRVSGHFEDRRCQPMIGAFGSRTFPSLCDRRHRHAEIWPRLSPNVVRHLCVLRALPKYLTFFDQQSERVREWFGICAQFSVLAHVVSYHAQKTVASLGSGEVRIEQAYAFLHEQNSSPIGSFRAAFGKCENGSVLVWRGAL